MAGIPPLVSRMMNIGFDTIGNATIICYDRVPVLVTDPWVVGTAYFGSWTLSHDIPEEQMAAVKTCRYVWYSHGHPDHLNLESLQLLRDKKILLPDHVGQRIYNDLAKDGYDVHVLRDRVWYRLSEHIKVLCIADYNQDGILLIDINGRLLVNLNDASSRGWGGFVRRLIRQYPVSFMLALQCYGDGDMINCYDESGARIQKLDPKLTPLGRRAALRMERFGTRYFVPFSYMHRYQRADSVWANKHGGALSDYNLGFAPHSGEMLPAFIRYDCVDDTLTKINPPERVLEVLPPAAFGDDWSEPLEADEAVEVKSYFKTIVHLAEFLDFVNVRVGGQDHIIELTKGKFDRGLTFEVPRQSLMTAVRYEVFDDLLIGNFMKTTFNGKWPKYSLYPDFSPYVAKYADNGRARSTSELRGYFAEYRRRAPANYLRHQVVELVHRLLEEKAADAVRSFLPMESRAYQTTRKIYRTFKKPTMR